MGRLIHPVWLYSTLEDLRGASPDVRDAMGRAIRAAQFGEMSDDANPMHGKLRDVVEIRARDRDGIYRLMYTTKIGDLLIVLDFFENKGVAGGATAKVDLDRVLQRYTIAKGRYGKTKAR